MNLNQFNISNIAGFGSTVFECNCKKEHIAKTKSIFFENEAVLKIPSEALKLVPPLSLIGIITDSDTKNMMGRTVEKSLSKEGLRVCSFIFENRLRPSVNEANTVSLPEDVKLIIGIGGGAISDITKYKAKQLGIDYILVLVQPLVISALVPSGILYNKNTESTFMVDAPKSVIIDTDLLLKADSKFTAAAFGGLISKITALFDYRFAHLINGEVFCDNIFEQGLAIIDELLQKLSFSSAKHSGVNALIAESSLKFSALCQLIENSRLLSGAETQGAHALELLLDFEQREKKLRGENEFLLSRVIMKIYKNILSKKESFFVPPPDNNLRLEKIKEYLGLEEGFVIDKIRPIISGPAQKIAAYKFDEYRDELYNFACDFDLRLSRAWKIFKRLYDDDGYSLVNYLDSFDVSLSLSLAPDLKEKYTMLTFMKNVGLLDTYLREVI